MLVTSKLMLEKAKKMKYAIIQPDFIDSNSAKVFCETAELLGKPIILAHAPGINTMTLQEAYMIGSFYAKRVKTDVCLHLDHGSNYEECKEAIDLGFTSVMIDMSSKSFDENVRETKRVVEYAHSKGVVVEAEIGHVGSNGSAEAVKKNESIYTTVEEAKKFVELTNVDSLAVSIGTSHGVYKGEPKINFERLYELASTIDIPLVLHGGSSSGDENLNKCAKNGISKINVFSDFLIEAYNEIKKTNTSNFFEIKDLESKAMKKVFEHYVKVFETN